MPFARYVLLFCIALLFYPMAGLVWAQGTQTTDFTSGVRLNMFSGSILIGNIEVVTSYAYNGVQHLPLTGDVLVVIGIRPGSQLAPGALESTARGVRLENDDGQNIMTSKHFVHPQNAPGPAETPTIGNESTPKVIGIEMRKEGPGGATQVIALGSIIIASMKASGLTTYLSFPGATPRVRLPSSAGGTSK